MHAPKACASSEALTRSSQEIPGQRHAVNPQPNNPVEIGRLTKTEGTIREGTQKAILALDKLVDVTSRLLKENGGCNL